MTPAAPVIPFDDSRRLTGPNLFFAACGAVLEVPASWAVDAPRELAWREHVLALSHALGWPPPELVVRRHAKGASLALTAPLDQIFTATSVNEWAWHDTLGLPWLPDDDLPDDPDADTLMPAITDPAAALARLRATSAAEHNARLMALHAQAMARDLPLLLDDDTLSLGAGSGSRTWPLDALPRVDEVDWPAHRRIPVALVTGTNGKTTTVRLLAEIARESGWRPGHSSTTGLVIDGQSVKPGDYAGPAGARAILRDDRVQIALLETARGGMLRRGLAVARADAAIVTNVSADHLGEYGIDDVDGVADTKLIVARAVADTGLLVLNADDAALLARSRRLDQPLAWFALDDAHPALLAHRARGGATCGVRQVDGCARMHLVVPAQGTDADLGAVAAMPLTVNGHAAYNVANLMGAALMASALGLPVAAVANVFARFGACRADNPGRLQHWRLAGDVNVFVDYAHNPEGLHGLLKVATTGPHKRLGLVLGQAGNRTDADIRELAATAARFNPAFVVLKDIAGMERGRPSGEAAHILRTELLRAGLPPEAVTFETREIDAARAALALAKPGDALVLPIHGPAALVEVQSLLDGLEAAV